MGERFLIHEVGHDVWLHLVHFRRTAGVWCTSAMWDSVDAAERFNKRTALAILVRFKKEDRDRVELILAAKR